MFTTVDVLTFVIIKNQNNMKKIILSIGMFLAVNAAFAQSKPVAPTLSNSNTPAIQAPATPAAPASSLKPENM